MAATDISTYTVEVPVADYSENERNKAFVTAFKQIITELSSNTKVTNLSSVKDKLKNIANWVQSYNYTKRTDTPNQQKIFLQIRFDKMSIPSDVTINQADEPTSPPIENTETIKEPAADFLDTPTSPTQHTPAAAVTHNLPNNPNILVWLVAIGDKTQQNIFIDDASTNELAQSLKKAANNANIKLILPTMDLEDLTNITADDVCNLDVNTIKTAAKRYGIENILTGCIAKENNNQHSEWLLITNKQKLHWTLASQNTNSLVTQAVNKVAEILQPALNNDQKQQSLQPQNTQLTPSVTTTPSSPLPAPTTTLTTIDNQPPSSVLTNPPLPPTTTQMQSLASEQNEQLPPNQVQLSITNITNLDQYAAVVKYLHALPKVEKIELQNINASTVKLKVTILGGKDAIVNLLKTQHQLTPNTNSNNTDNQDATTLNYNWQPDLTNANI